MSERLDSSHSVQFGGREGGPRSLPIPTMASPRSLPAYQEPYVREFSDLMARAPDMAVAVAAIKVQNAHACCFLKEGAAAGSQRACRPRGLRVAPDLKPPLCATRFARHPHMPHARRTQALTSVIRRSAATTMMELDVELKDAAAALQRCNPTQISLKAGCELFLR